jgi:hypothetical protein
LKVGDKGLEVKSNQDVFMRGRLQGTRHSGKYFYPYLDLASTPWEDNQLGLVCLKPLDISLQSLEGFVLAAVIHRNANRRGKLLWNAGSLQSIR